MHVLMAVDKVGRAPQGDLERRELTIDLLPDLLNLKSAHESSAQQFWESCEITSRRMGRHCAERLAGGQIQVQPDADVAAGRQLAGEARPPWPVRHRARGRDAARAGEVENGAAYAPGEAEIVGA
jgi:hypothetical protein